MTGFLGKRTASNPSFQSQLSAFPLIIRYILYIYIKILKHHYILYFQIFPTLFCQPLDIIRLGPYAPHASRPTPPGSFRMWPWPDATPPGSFLQRWVSALRPGDFAKHCNGTWNLLRPRPELGLDGAWILSRRFFLVEKICEAERKLGFKKKRMERWRMVCEWL